MSEGEPDSTPVTAGHVSDFLAWYGQRTGLRGIHLNQEWWFNALHTLTLGELRNGIRSYMRFTSRLHLSPVEFWNLCKAKQDQQSIERFRQLRATVTAAPPQPARKKQRWKEELVRPRIKKSD